MAKQGQGSAGVAIAVTAVIVIALTSIGYYQYVVVGTSTSTETSSTSTHPYPLINITLGAATKTNDAYSPNPVTLVIGVNNTFEVFNGDIQGGVGVPHSYTDMAKTPGFDSGVLQGGDTSKPITVTAPGTYTVFCLVHPTTMRGQLKVVQGTGGGTGSSSSATATHSGNATSSRTNSSSSGSGVSAVILPGTSTNITSAGFNPRTITVVIGVNNTVTWKNMDNASHTVTAKDGSFDSGNLDSTKSFSHTFDTAGIFEIKCSYHSWMHETVIVKAKS
jgi:plastocyanin